MGICFEHRCGSHMIECNLRTGLAAGCAAWQSNTRTAHAVGRITNLRPGPWSPPTSANVPRVGDLPQGMNYSTGLVLDDFFPDLFLYSALMIADEPKLLEPIKIGLRPESWTTTALPGRENGPGRVPDLPLARDRISSQVALLELTGAQCLLSEMFSSLSNFRREHFDSKCSF